jgi:hypothetical protein
MGSELRLRADGLDWREVSGRIVALLPGSSGHVVVNATGAVLWRALVSGADRGRLVITLVEAFAIDEQRAERDVDAFLAALRSRGLLAV